MDYNYIHDHISKEVSIILLDNAQTYLKQKIKDMPANINSPTNIICVHKNHAQYLNLKYLSFHEKLKYNDNTISKSSHDDIIRYSYYNIPTLENNIIGRMFIDKTGDIGIAKTVYKSSDPFVDVMLTTIDECEIWQSLTSGRTNIGFITISAFCPEHNYALYSNNTYHNIYRYNKLAPNGFSYGHACPSEYGFHTDHCLSAWFSPKSGIIGQFSYKLISKSLRNFSLEYEIKLADRPDEIYTSRWLNTKLLIKKKMTLYTDRYINNRMNNYIYLDEVIHLDDFSHFDSNNITILSPSTRFLHLQEVYKYIKELILDPCRIKNINTIKF